MTAIAAPNFAPTVWPDWRRLVSIGTASERLDYTRDHLSELCREKLEARRLAYYGQHPNGGQPQWFIHVEYDMRLAAGPVADGWVEPDLSAYTARQRSDSLQRRACVEAFQSAQCQGRVSRDQVECLIEQLQSRFDGLSISRSRLYAWSKLYRRPADTIKLIDNRGGYRNAKPDDAAWKMFADLYLHQNRPSIRRCWLAVKETAIAKGWKWCEEDACRYQLNDRIPIQEQVKHRDPEHYRTSMAPFIAQDPRRGPRTNATSAITNSLTSSANGRGI